MGSNNQYALGQRWLSNTESELGLGTIIALNDRTIDILFPATGQNRTYAPNTAPLTRVTFEVGNTVQCHEGWTMLVSRVTEQNGMLTYVGKRSDSGLNVELKETFIDHHFQLNQPQQRLLASQVDEPKWFDIRQQCINHQYQHATSPLLGFVGARVDIIPHQLHIAAEVGRRHAPRVLLADEVGLGKTIEAALIIHQQLLTHRAQRVLIVVPDTLVHQWLVEMLRRVNLAFSIFDEPRCQSLAEEATNPFETEQLVICSLDFLTHNSRYFQQACEAQWDLMVVDEAHHLAWSKEHVSEQYAVIEQLANVTKGVLLLTATPDQLGHESHFARLRLLDPARFHDYQAFVAQEQQYSQLAQAIAPLLEQQEQVALSADAIGQIASFAGQQLLAETDLADTRQRARLINQLLDRHGTGRLLFRNSRTGVSGFPKRHLLEYPLSLPTEYIEPLQQAASPAMMLTPERLAEVATTWINVDPRVDWFIEQLRELKGHKVLAICAHASTALMLSEAIRNKSGIRAGVFHEGQSIVERDRIANYFAQDEEGAQVLICSEIGSEGRNFQFAHHLILFDLPLVPDLLEQRIGRLDRIGQKHDVMLHVPFFVNSAQQIMLDWYHDGLDAFEHTCPIGTSVFEQVDEGLFACLFEPDNEMLKRQLIEQTQMLNQQMRQKLEQGRDRLLEINSSGHGRVEPLLQAIEDADNSPTLERFMTTLFDTIGVLQEDRDDASYFLRPTESMHSQIPGLDEEGMTITYERRTATALENIHFFSWDHPMVQHAMDTVTTDVHGKSAIGMQRDKSLPAGFYWLECLFVLSSKGEKSLQLERFLPPTPLRICVDARGQETDKVFYQLERVGSKVSNQVIRALASAIENSITMASELAQQHSLRLKQTCLDNMQELLTEELSRLRALSEVNPSVRQEEIDFLVHQKSALSEAIDKADVHLEAIRLVVNNH